MALDALNANFSALLNSMSMILVSEIGDKTFLIAAILSMRHPRFTVFMGAFSSLVVMSLLSAEMGHLLPHLIPKRWTQVAAGILFLVFGVRMVFEGVAMEGGTEKIKEEMREVGEEIEMEDHNGGDLESGRSTQKNKEEGWMEGARNFSSFFLGPVFVQAFVLTFLGEWGDRSQIATIALGAAHNVYVVTAGTVFGHSICTAIAVFAGRYVASKISVKHVTLGGSALFLLFGIIYLWEAYSMTEELDVLLPDHEIDSAVGVI